MLNGEGHENTPPKWVGPRAIILLWLLVGLISEKQKQKKTWRVQHTCLPLHVTITWNLQKLPSYTTGGPDVVCVNILIFTWTKWDESWHIWRGLIIGCMFCLQIEGPIVGGGGSRGGSRPSDKRGGGHLVSEKKGGQFQKKFFLPQFGLKIEGVGVPGPFPWICHWGDVITGSSRWLTDRQQ